MLSLMPPADFAKRRKKTDVEYLIDQAVKPSGHSTNTIQRVIQFCVCNIKELDLLPGDIDL